MPTDDTPDLRKRGLALRAFEAGVRILEKQAGHERCTAHCKCVTVLRFKASIIFALLLAAAVAIVRREVISYVPRVPEAPPPIIQGNRLPGLDPVKP